MVSVDGPDVSSCNSHVKACGGICSNGAPSSRGGVAQTAPWRFWKFKKKFGNFVKHYSVSHKSCQT